MMILSLIKYPPFSAVAIAIAGITLSFLDPTLEAHLEKPVRNLYSYLQNDLEKSRK